MDNPKKILIVDDSALMRRIVCDIIATDSKFCVEDMAENGEVALSLLEKKSYDLVILDMVMPKVDGLEVLLQIKLRGIQTSVVVFSREVSEGADITIQALELGAADFIQKPKSIVVAKSDSFVSRFVSILECAVGIDKKQKKLEKNPKADSLLKPLNISHMPKAKAGNRIVAIATSTGGPRALQQVLPFLPENLDAPVLVVQHMPEGFTASLAQRLNEYCPLHIQEAAQGMEITKGNVYIAKGGKHMEVVVREGRHFLTLKDGPTREGVRPCANFMYESLADSRYDEVICVVMTGMGADGTEGILNLQKKKPITIIAQEQSTCAVYGMPRSIVSEGLPCQIEPLQTIAEAITKNAGVE